jgi:hypothetical protein
VALLLLAGLSFKALGQELSFVLCKSVKAWCWHGMGGWELWGLCPSKSWYFMLEGAALAEHFSLMNS